MKGVAISRRRALQAGAAAPLATGLAAAAPARAGAPQQGAQGHRFYRFPLGAFEVNGLLASTNAADEPHAIFGLDVSDERFAEVARENFLPADRSLFVYQPTLVNTGEALVLFDTGNTGANLAGAIETAGYAPGDVDLVVISHMHPDHIGGLMTDGARTLPNARYAAGRVEYDAWAEMDNDLFEANVRPLEGDMSFLEDGDMVAPGITAMAAFGHTPGHMVFRLESEGTPLMLTADTANHAAFSLERPDWRVSFDMDHAKAAETRHRVFGMIAEKRLPFLGYHLPFPGIGYVRAEGEGFRYVPESYQMLVG